MSKVLLLEPDIVLQKIYSNCIELAGHEVIGCQTAQNALNKVEDYQPDVIVLEIQLIDHSGIEFLYELRSYAQWQSIPVVIISIVGGQVLERSKKVLFNNLAVSSYINKYDPTSSEQLIESINKYTREDSRVAKR